MAGVKITPRDEVTIPEVVLDPKNRLHVVEVNTNRYAAPLGGKHVEGVPRRREIVRDSLVHDPISHVDDDFLLHSALRLLGEGPPATFES
jgi:hypothetical protein